VEISSRGQNQFCGKNRLVKTAGDQDFPFHEGIHSKEKKPSFQVSLYS